MNHNWPEFSKLLGVIDVSQVSDAVRVCVCSNTWPLFVNPTVVQAFDKAILFIDYE